MTIHPPPPDHRGSLDYPTGCNAKAVVNWARSAARVLAPLLADQPHNVVLLCRGGSGAILASALNMLLPEPAKILHLKKPGENSHSGVPNIPYNARVVIVDDFIRSGETIRALVEHVATNTNTKCPEIFAMVFGDFSGSTIEWVRDILVARGRCHVQHLINIA